MEYLTLKELTVRWKVGDSTLRRWMRTGKLPVVRLGKGIRVDLAEVERIEATWKAGEKREEPA